MIRNALVGLAIASLTACTTTGGYPPLADIQAVTEAKPLPTSEILTDPAADARYNASIESTLDRVHAAAMRLCRFYVRTGMAGVECSEK
jgi:hypothetical protein